MTKLADLKPASKPNLMDLVEEAGHDVSDWKMSKTPASNPKYCYEWCFHDPKVGFILNLWHEEMEESGETISFKGNMRKMIERAKNPRLNKKQKQAAVSRIKRAKIFDSLLESASRSNQPFRVIIQSGNPRNIDEYESAKVTNRKLDDVSWRLDTYDKMTGDYTLIRGVKNKFIDQHEAFAHLAQTAPDKSTRTSTAYNRSKKIRDFVLNRANGYCEFCGEKGFETPKGIYLETHHIISLCENGSDTVENVIALCPNDHKRAHFCIQKAKMQEQLFAAISDVK